MLKRTLYSRLLPNEARVDRYMAVIQRKLNQCQAALHDGPPGEAMRLMEQHSFLAHSMFRAIDKRNGDV
jgi:hypothetical protein